MNIVFVDDSKVDVELLTLQLKAAGIIVDGTLAQDEAQFRAALALNPDIILADYVMPELGAIRALAILRELDSTVPLIVVSGAIKEEVAVATISAGAVDYVLKDRPQRLPLAILEAREKARLRKAEKEYSIAREAAGDRYFRDLERRIGEDHSAIQEIAPKVDRIYGDLYGDPGARSGPPSLFEQIAAMQTEMRAGFTQLGGQIQEHERQIKTWLTYQRAAGGVFMLVTQLPLLRWIKRFFTLASATFLGVVLGMAAWIFVQTWR